MKKLFIIIVAIGISISSIAQSIERGTQLFNSDWRFHRGGALGSENQDFDDSQWKTLSLPHDWSIEDIPGTDSPFHLNAIRQVSGGFTEGGTGWYRKKFNIPAELEGRRFVIQFDGAYMNSTVWINGRWLGRHPYGYTTFWFDMTSHIEFGKENAIAVQVMNEGENSRWYSGSGLYRHVWLKVLNPIHVAQWGTFITTPEVTQNAATVSVQTNVVNTLKDAAQVRLKTLILAPNGALVAESEATQLINPDASADFSQNINVARPMLWSTETPALYKAIQEVFVNNQQTDRQETTFGIRTISFDVKNGFLLNGKPVLLKGGNVHHDNGPLGAKAYDRAEERRVELLKASGFNAIRCAHNPPSKAFLDACDRLGMLVINESFDMWEGSKKPFDYHLYFRDWWKKDIESMVLRDRNHPSIIMWSTGNEIPERGRPQGVRTSQMLAEHVRSLDPTRPITAAVQELTPDKDPYFATLDLAGYNYPGWATSTGKSTYQTDHQRVPNRIIFCSESYPLEAFQSWMGVVDYPFVFGDFVWTAFDYLGEASLGWHGYPQKRDFYPWNLAWCGDLDICGWKRPQSYYRDALWMSNQLSVFVKPPTPAFEEKNPERDPWSKWHWHDEVADWNWSGYEGTPFEVSVYSSCPEVELFLNGKSLGRKKTDRSTEFMAKWEVPYQPGSLRAVGLQGRKTLNTAELRTADQPLNIHFSADRIEIKADGQDLSYITVELRDSRGIRHPKAENLMRFEIEGTGEIIAVGNANPVSLESYQKPQRKAWQGRCMVIVKSNGQGEITLKASSDGLNPAQVVVVAR